MEFEELVQAVQSLNTDDAFRARLDRVQWRTLAGYLTPHTLRSGELLIREGEVDRSAYFLGRGSLQVYRVQSQGGQRVVLLRPGAMVGETGLFAAAPHSVQVEAMSPCIVWALRLPRFEELCSRTPNLAVEVLRGAGAVIAARLRAQVDQPAAVKA